VAGTLVWETIEIPKTRIHYSSVLGRRKRATKYAIIPTPIDVTRIKTNKPNSTLKSLATAIGAINDKNHVPPSPDDTVSAPIWRV
jgi:hypothetical protein